MTETDFLEKEVGRISADRRRLGKESVTKSDASPPFVVVAQQPGICEQKSPAVVQQRGFDSSQFSHWHKASVEIRSCKAGKQRSELTLISVLQRP